MKSTTDVQKFVEHVEQMRKLAAGTPVECVEDVLYGYLEAARCVYGTDSLMVEWITAEYLNLLGAN